MKTHSSWRRLSRLAAAALALSASRASAFSDATCVGDCNRDRSTSIAELVTGSNIALGKMSIAECRGFDPSGDGAVTIDELVGGVRSALHGCPSYGATIRRTAFGIPHIKASDFGSLGFGQGYAVAEDHLCTVVDQAIKLRSRRAFFFGRGTNDRHLNSDLAYLALDLQGRAERALAGLDAETRSFFDGYAAGVNAFLADTAPDALPGWCAGESWVGPITATDVAARGLDLTLNASAVNLIDYIATASPPGEGASAPPPDALAAATRAAAPTLGSNGWAIGAERSENGRGMLVANPHFPWVGENRFWESHLTLPGVLDVYGVSLIGIPGVQIGFNENVAWTHTYSAGKRLTAYTLDLVPGDPTSYLYDGTPRAMSSREVAVEVREADGSITTVRRRMWSSHYGPMLNFPTLGWTATFALTYRDANIDDGEVIAQLFGMDRASSLADFQRVYAEVQGIPFANTIAASPDGTVWYADTSATPNLSAAAIAAWRDEVQIDPLVGFAYENLGTVLLDGSRSLFEWVDAPGARDPGLVPYSAMPQLTRRDYVFNSNDSYWIANGEQFLAGFSPLHGEERVPLSPRTRQNLFTLSDRSEDGASGSDGRFSLAELQAAILSNRGLLADLLRESTVERCMMPAIAESLKNIIHAQETDEGTGIAEACGVLAAWDGKADRDSAGAALWREFVTSFGFADVRGDPGGILFANPFDDDDPIGTPNGLAPPPASGSDPILDHLLGAMHALDAAGVPLGAALGDLQHTDRNGTRIPIHGGVGFEGVENIVDYAGLDAGNNAIAPLNSTLEPLPHPGPLATGSGQLRDEGYPVDFGTSFLLTMEFTDDGPCGSAVLTYGESGDPLSPHFSDQTELFSEKRLRPVLFTEAQIEGDPGLRRYSVRSSAREEP